MCCFVASPIICFLAPKECHRYTNNTLFINILRRDFHSFNDARHQRRTVMPAWSVPAPACMCVFQYKCTRTRTPDGTGAGCRAHSIADRSPQYLQRVIRFVRNTERERDEKKKKKYTNIFCYRGAVTRYIGYTIMCRCRWRTRECRRSKLHVGIVGDAMRCMRLRTPPTETTKNQKNTTLKL